MVANAFAPLKSKTKFYSLRAGIILKNNLRKQVRVLDVVCDTADCPCRDPGLSCNENACQCAVASQNARSIEKPCNDDLCPCKNDAFVCTGNKCVCTVDG